MDKKPQVLEKEHARFNSMILELSEYETNCSKFFMELFKIVKRHYIKEEAVLLPLLAYMDSRLKSGVEVDPAPLEESYLQFLQNYEALIDDHNNMRKMLDEAMNQTYRVEVQTLIGEILHHIQMEEEIVYPAAVAAGEILHRDYPIPRKAFR